MRRISKEEVEVLVVKVGSSIICENNRLNLDKVNRLVKQFISLFCQDIKLIIVSSGAIAAGIQKLKLSQKPKDLPGLQAAAAIGQSQLMAAYAGAFSKENINSAQILLTREDIHERNRYLNAKNTFLRLLEYRTVPIVNENDTVAVEEINFGDNDTLSSLVATLVDADLLIILSDIDGIYVPEARIKDFKNVEFYELRKENKEGDLRVMKQVSEVSYGLEELCQGAGALTTVGGMTTKIYAARTATNCGIPCVIANGNKENVLLDIINGREIGTYFFASLEKKCARKRWIGYGTHSKGKIIVDKGARVALLDKGRSLLPSGIVDIDGAFQAGETVLVSSPQDEVIAKGIVNYSDKEIRKIKGKKTNEIKKYLGYKYYDEIIHRDNLILL